MIEVIQVTLLVLAGALGFGVMGFAQLERRRSTQFGVSQPHRVPPAAALPDPEPREFVSSMDVQPQL